MADKDQGIKIVSTNRKARFKYAIEDTYEVGIELVGAEVKSLREGNCSIQESYARPVGSELYLFDMHVAPYAQATVDRPDPLRRRRLLLHRRELNRIIAQCTQRGYTLVPLKVYFRAGWAKLELALARGKKLGDRREKELRKQRQQDIRSALKRRKGPSAR